MVLIPRAFGVVAYIRICFFNDTATTEIYTLSLHDALPIYGNLVNTRELLDQLRGGRSRLSASTDTELLTALIADEPAADTVDALLRVLPRVRGAFSLVILDEKHVIGVRDPHGFRPHPDDVFLVEDDQAERPTHTGQDPEQGRSAWSSSTRNTSSGM